MNKIKKTKTLIKELLEIEEELKNREPEDIIKTIDKLHINNSSLISVIYEGACDDAGYSMN